MNKVEVPFQNGSLGRGDFLETDFEHSNENGSVSENFWIKAKLLQPPWIK